VEEGDSFNSENEKTGAIQKVYQELPKNQNEGLSSKIDALNKKVLGYLMKESQKIKSSAQKQQKNV
jgi:hypothetical protein